MLTASGDAEDNHYDDLIHTADFLLEHDADAVDTLRHGFRDLRHGLLQAGRDGGRAARAAKAQVEPVLRRVMVRTERLGATSDRSGMLAERPCEGLDLPPVGRRLATWPGPALPGPSSVYDPMEYWLSAPNLVNFMDGYKLNEAFDDKTERPRRRRRRPGSWGRAARLRPGAKLRRDRPRQRSHALAGRRRRRPGRVEAPVGAAVAPLPPAGWPLRRAGAAGLHQAAHLLVVDAGARGQSRRW